MAASKRDMQLSPPLLLLLLCVASALPDVTHAAKEEGNLVFAYTVFVMRQEYVYANPAGRDMTVVLGYVRRIAAGMETIKKRCDCAPWFTGEDCSLALCPDDCSGRLACSLKRNSHW
eukprot:753841-Hanusia_phi.AAC.3